MDFITLDEIKDFGLNTSKMEFAPTIPPHFHNHYEILYFIKGDAYYMVEGNNYALTEGDLLITNPRELHCPVFKSKNEYKRTVITIKPSFLSDFITEKYSPFYALDKRNLGSQNRIPCEIVKKYNLHEKIAMLEYYYKGNLRESEIMIKTYLIQLLVALNNIVLQENPLGKTSNIDIVLQYINRHLTDKLTLLSLEKEFHLSKYHIAHSFKEKTGLTIMEYITKKRLVLAKEMILDGVSLNEAAEKVGFSDYSNFYRSFKKAMGFSPKDLRKLV